MSTTYYHQQDQLLLEHTEHSEGETCCFVIYGLFSPRLSVNIHLAYFELYVIDCVETCLTSDVMFSKKHFIVHISKEYVSIKGVENILIRVKSFFKIGLVYQVTLPYEVCKYIKIYTITLFDEMLAEID